MNEVASKSVLSKMLSLFWEPSGTFTALKERTTAYDVVIPLLIVAVLSMLLIPVITPVALQEYKVRIEDSERLTDAQKEAQIERLENRGNEVTKYVMTAVTIVLKVLIVALFAWFAGNFVLGGEARFVPIFAVTAYVGLIDLISIAVKYPLMISQETTRIHTSPALFLPESTTFLYRFLATLDIFAVWKLVLLSIGVGIINQIKTNKVFWTLLIMWLLYCVAAAGLGGLVKI